MERIENNTLLHRFSSSLARRITKAKKVLLRRYLYRILKADIGSSLLSLHIAMTMTSQFILMSLAKRIKIYCVAKGKREVRRLSGV